MSPELHVLHVRERVVTIKTERGARMLDFGGRPPLGALKFFALATPVVFGLLHTAQSRAQPQTQNTAATSLLYEVASIKPNKSGDNRIRLMYSPDGLSATNCTLQMLIKAAYGVENNQISGAPNWLNSDKYDVEAKMDGSATEEMRKLSEDQRKVE